MRVLALAIAVFLASFSAEASSLDAVESKRFTVSNFKLDNGATLPELTLAYETYGELAADGRNAVLIEHSYTSSHHAAGFYSENGAPPGEKAGAVGWWDKVIGPGEAIDTDKLFVISSNALGSSYGSTNPASLDPTTGKSYGPDFPAFTVADIMRAQKALLDSLGVKHLVLVAGPSFGGFEAFQWAVGYPDFVSGVAPLLTSPYSPFSPHGDEALTAALAKDPNWNGGHYYDRGGVTATLTKLRVTILESYGIEALFKDRIPNPAMRQAAIMAIAKTWAEAFDANGLVSLLRAHETFDVRPQFSRIKAKVLYLLSRTDKQFPPSIAPPVMDALKAAGVDARYFEVDSEIGHLAFGYQTERWSPALRKFVAELMP
jgi:homoserine O-acetyltransferase/O-succinyltransferase